MSAVDKATPRPWSVGHTEKQNYGGGVIMHCTGVHVGEGRLRGNMIAQVVMGGDGGTQSTAEVVEANAALIVSAVNRDHLFDELVNALEEAIGALSRVESDIDYQFDNDFTPEDELLVNRLSAVLAKAKAVQP